MAHLDRLMVVHLLVREEHPLKYALLIYTRPGSHESLSTADYTAVRGEYMALAGGQTLVTDGPFADTKEVFGGYYI